MNVLQKVFNRCKEKLRSDKSTSTHFLQNEKVLLEKNFSKEKPLKVLFLANSLIPNLEISFTSPLSKIIDQKIIDDYLLTETELKEFAKFSVNKQAKMVELLDQVWESHQPDLVVSCRYSGPLSSEIISKCNRDNVPVILYLDDDLLNVPKELGPRKYAYHNHPERTGAIQIFMNQADVIYSSTEELAKKINSYGSKTKVVTAQIFCAGKEFSSSTKPDPTVFGYMGFGHGHDLDIVLPGIVSLLDRRSELTFELFGSIPKPKELEKYGSRVVVRPPVRSSYDEFLEAMNDLNWSVGITPLANLEFNLFKANTKWVEYSSAGIAVVSNDHVAYRDVISNGCGLLVHENEDWGVAIETLLNDQRLRESCVANAQDKLTQQFNQIRLQNQVLDLFSQVGVSLEFSEELSHTA